MSASPAPIHTTLAPGGSSGLSSSSIIGIAIGIVVVVFIGVFIFAKLYIWRYENKVVASYAQRRRDEAAAEETHRMEASTGGSSTTAGPMTGLVVSTAPIDVVTSGGATFVPADSLRRNKPSMDDSQRHRARDDILQAAATRKKASLATNGNGGLGDFVQRGNATDLIPASTPNVRKSTKHIVTGTGDDTPFVGAASVQTQQRSLAPAAAAAYSNQRPSPLVGSAATVPPVAAVPKASTAFSPVNSDDDHDDGDAGTQGGGGGGGAFTEQQRAAYLEDLGFTPREGEATTAAKAHSHSGGRSASTAIPSGFEGLQFEFETTP